MELLSLDELENEKEILLRKVELFNKKLRINSRPAFGMLEEE